MLTQKLIQFNDTKQDLLFWIKNYIASKLYSINAVRNKREEFLNKREKFYKLILNSKNITDLHENSKEVIRSGLNGLRVYITPLVPFFNVVAENKKIKKLVSIKDIDTNYLNSYASWKYEKLKDDTRRSYYNQIKSLFKFIDEKSKDKDNFKFNMGFLKDGTKVTSPVRGSFQKKFKFIPPKLFEQFVESIKTYKSKRVDSFNQKLMMKFFCFGGLRSIETRFIKKTDCNKKKILGNDYLEVYIADKGGHPRYVYIKYDFIKADYEKTLELNKNCEYLFYSKFNDVYEEKTVYKLVERFYNNADINAKKLGLGVHSLRSSFAIYLHSKGVALDTVITLLGRVDDEVKTLYLYVVEDKIKKIPKLFENI